MGCCIVGIGQAGWLVGWLGSARLTQGGPTIYNGTSIFFSSVFRFGASSRPTFWRAMH